ncbi:MAG TPA: CDP-archaeol synthase [Candidatus Andersenbacteria bacterium]|nr:CDP-archaeol synthase [Candidatus Andersenbacteria bacterium]
MNLSQLLITTLLIYLPAMIANMAPIFAAKWNVFPRLNRALDFGVSIQGIRLLGSHKTIRGFLAAIFAGSITGGIEATYMQQELLFGFLIGALVGFGAIMGDAIKSFFKRRLHIAPGSSFIPFDQIDFVIGATVVEIFFIPISLEQFITAIICIGFASYIVSSIAIALHFKKTL